MTPSKRITIPSSVRQYVFERDRFQCQGCGHGTIAQGWQGGSGATGD